MAGIALLTAVTANGNSQITPRPGARVVQNKLLWSKTGTGTATLDVVDVDTGTKLITSISILAGAQSGAVDFFGSRSVQAQLSSVAGAVSVNAWLDGWE